MTHTECAHCHTDLSDESHGITGLATGNIQHWCSQCLAQGHCPNWLRQGSGWVEVTIESGPTRPHDTTP